MASNTTSPENDQVDPNEEDLKTFDKGNEFRDSRGNATTLDEIVEQHGSGSQDQVDAEGWNKLTHLSRSELLLGLCSILAWFALFTGGSLISTGEYRSNLEDFESVSNTLGSWVVVCAFWTITNVGILSCIASLLGALGGRSQFTIQTELHNALTESPYPKFDRVLATYYASAVMRGFGIYVLVLAGLLVLATESLIAPSQAAYVRLAPTISIISFYAGYDPSMFAGLLGRVRSFVNTSEEKPA